MKIKFSLPFLAIIFLSIALSVNGNPQRPQRGQSARPASPPAHRITSSSAQPFIIYWKQADSLANLGQPKSALEIVEKIYSQAKTAGDDPQVIKAIIYRIRLNSEFQENFLKNSITSLQKEISVAPQPRMQVLQSILAEVYWKYYQNNQYRFRDRTQVKENVPDSLETWDLATISSAITQTYLLSLKHADTLQRFAIGKYDAILELEVFDDGKQDTTTTLAAKFTPTLFDFLAGRALDYFTTGEINPELPASYALNIFRDLAAFHQPDSDHRAMIDIELRRLAFVHEKSVNPAKDSIYLAALRKYEVAENSSPWSTAISFALATFLNGQGQLYQPLISDMHKWDIRSAMEVCDKAIQRFPASAGAKNCKILAAGIREQFLQVTTEYAVPVGKPSLALVGVKNIKQLYFRLVKVDPEINSEKAGTSDRAGYIKFLSSLPAARSWTQTFPDDGDFQKHQTEVKIPEVPVGFWVLLCTPSKDFSDIKQTFAFTPLWSTQISYVNKRNNDGSFAYFLLDRETGLPLKNAVAEVWEKNYDYQSRTYSKVKRQNYTSDGQGYFIIPPAEENRHNANQFLKIYFKDDFMITDNFYLYPVYKGPEQTYIQTMFYTDRAIYRPGQAIYFKGILLERTGDRSKIKPNHATKVVFTDVNGQKISEQSLTSNEFGSVNGSFIAPTGVLPGQMTIYNETGSASISVEEYKRPTFEVSGELLEGNYRLGEVLKVTGKAMAYSGNPIGSAQVKYRVVRTARFPFWDWGWRWPMPASPELEITNGTTTTDAEGKFQVSFPAIPDSSIDKKSWPVFDFSVYADVTDLNGETQSAEQQITVGYKSLLVETNLPELVNMAKDTLMKVSTTNLNGRPTPSTVTISLQRLRQPDRVFKKRMWDRPDRHIMTMEEFRAQFPEDIFDNENDPSTWAKEELVFEKTINTLSDSLLNLQAPGLRIPRPGSYLLILRSTDPFGELVEVKKVLTAFSPVSKEVPVNTADWFVPLKISGEPGENARFLIGSRSDNVNMIYEIRLNDSLVSREWIKLNNRAMLLEIPIREHYRGNFSVNFMFVSHNRVFQHSQVVNVPHVSKKLDVAFETFRDKLEPGAKERWKIKISGPGGKPANAEFLAGMYDASLDQFRPNAWAFNIYQRYSGVVPWDIDNTFRISSGQWLSSGENNGNYVVHPGLKLNWFGMNYFGGGQRYSRQSGGRMEKSMRPEMMDGMTTTAMPSAEMQPPPEMNQQKVADTSGAAANGLRPGKTTVEPVVQVRRDFRETAFFYPALKTDSTGSLILQFTAPESLTKWKLLGLAHSKNLDYGMVEKELVTRKELMVFPNAPRFVRQGDTVIFSSKIVNMSDHDLSGKVTLALADAITLQNLNMLIDTAAENGPGMREQAFSAKKGESTVVSWRLFIPLSTGLAVLQYRITAVSENFSDGEEKAIPVLTNRMMVTESLPLPVRGKGTVEFSFDKLLRSGSGSNPDATLKNHKLTLEFASNPAWYAIQALPTLNDIRYENADAIFAAFWTNSVAAFIANSNPKIKAVFESWKNLTPDALQSNLAKNQELKSALLQETPWVTEAANETGRKQKLGLFFDPDNLARNLDENLRKLQKLQSPNGGWMWFPGMPESRYITQNILTGLGHLHHLGVTNILKDQASRNMVMNAITYLDGELQKDYENLKKYQPGNLEGNHLGNLHIQYLYARSYFMNNPEIRLPAPSVTFTEAFSYYKKQASRYWLQNDRYLQGMIALALNRIEGKEVPLMILKSLSEKALHSAEMGMYWAGERGYYWYQAPIETQALMIEAFDEIAQDKPTVEELKIWLLKQKQTQDWRSPRATVEAVYALLLRGTDLLADDPGVKISLGSEKVSSDKLIDVKKEAGTGYFQVSWSGSEIKPEMGKITVSKSGEGVAWGAVYWQYFENLDKITQASTPLHLEKKLFVETNTPNGPVLVSISNNEHRISNIELKTGDKVVVRIVLTVDRDLEYVHMKDMRASGFEPLLLNPAPRKGEGSGASLSGYRYQDGLGYYQSTTDQATNFFFGYLPKGTYVFEYALKVNAAGEYSNGITSIQCMYAPEFSAHSEGLRVRVR